MYEVVNVVCCNMLKVGIALRVYQ